MNGLSVIIPSKNAANIKQCVAAVRKHEPDAQIIVIDDGIDPSEIGWGIGPDDPFCVPGVQPFVFARNCNIGIRFAGDDDIVLLNDDALLESAGGFSAMQRVAAEHPNLGLISATTNYAGNPAQHRRPGGGWRRLLDKTPGNSFPTVAFVCVLIPRRILNEVGVMDERFGGFTPEGKRIYGFCDNDYCRRVFESGFEVAIHDGCFVDHSKLVSSFRGTPGGQIDMEAARKLYLEKWGSM